MTTMLDALRKVHLLQQLRDINRFHKASGSNDGWVQLRDPLTRKLSENLGLGKILPIFSQTPDCGSYFRAVIADQQGPPKARAAKVSVPDIWT